MPCPPLPSEDLDHVLKHTLPLWEEAYGRTFFITGGTGFFGMWLLESFAHINAHLNLGMRATVLTRSPAAFAAKAPHLATRSDLTFIHGDVRDFELPGEPFDYIIHAATEASVKLNEELPEEMFDAIIGGTRRVLELAARCGVRKLLLTSSGAVYGKQPPEMTHVPETYAGAPDPLLPDSAYGVGKRASEHMCVVHARRHGYEAKVARCFAFVGPHLPLDTHFAIGNFIRDALQGDPILIGGDGSPMRSYLYASDLAVWLWTLLFKAPSSRAYNVGSAAALDIAALAATVRQSLAPDIDIRIARAAEPGAPRSRYVPSIDRAHADLALSVSVDLKTAISKTGRWHAVPVT